MHLTHAYITSNTSGQGGMECVLPGFRGPAQNKVAISTGLVPLCTTPLHPGVMRKTPLVLEGALVPTALWADKWMFKALEE